MKDFWSKQSPAPKRDGTIDAISHQGASVRPRRGPQRYVPRPAIL
jgi:hypothetical protein